MPIRKVILPPTAHSRGPTRTWGYTTADLAKLFGVRDYTVRDWIRTGKLDPADLADIARKLHERGSKKSE
jgi:hypothetical protein